MREGGVELDTFLGQSARSGSFFTAYFRPLSPNDPHENFSISASAVRSTDAHRARAYMMETVVPDFVLWARSLIVLPVNSPIRRERQSFSREFV